MRHSHSRSQSASPPEGFGGATCVRRATRWPRPDRPQEAPSCERGIGRSRRAEARPASAKPKAARGEMRSTALRRTSKGMPKIRPWATLTALVMKATHRPASTPTPIASAVMPNSLARNLARAVASIIGGGRGTEISRARRRRAEPCPSLCAAALPCQGCRDRPPAIMPQSPESAMSSRWIISARPAISRIWAISRELRPRMRSACSAS